MRETEWFDDARLYATAKQRADSYVAPAVLAMDGGVLIYDDAPQVRLAEHGLIAAFIGLAEAGDDSIESFARKHGVLEICGTHRLPRSHNDLTPAQLLVGEDRSCGVTPWPPPGRLWPQVDFQTTGRLCWESADDWRRLARSARDTLRAAREVAAGDAVATETWESVFSWSGFFREATRARVIADESLVLMAVNSWLDLGNVRVHAYLGAEAEPAGRLIVSGDRLFGRLANELALLAVQGAPLLSCDGCGRMYERRVRAPARGRLQFCDECRGLGISGRLAQRRYSASKRTNGEGSRGK